MVTTCLLIASCSSHNNTPIDTESLQHKADRLVSELNNQGEQVDKVILTSEDLRESFSSDKGFTNINIGKLNERSGLVEFADGLRILSSESQPKTLSSQLLACEPYVQARSFIGYAGMKAKINLPISVYGLDNVEEAAYTYIGLYTNTTIRNGGRTEGGFFIPSPRDTYTANVYYPYVKATLSSGYFYLDFKNELSNTTTEGIARGTNVSVSQKVLKTTENGFDVYKLSTIFQILDSSRTNVVKSFAHIYPTTGSYFSSNARTSLAGGKTTSYLATTRNYNDGIFDARWFDASLINANFYDGNPRSSYVYSETLLTPDKTACT